MPLSTVSSHPYLGITLDTKLTWVEEVSRFLADSSAFGPGDTKLVLGLAISCNAYDTGLHLACFVYPISCLVNGNLVESTFGSLYNEVPVHELCVDPGTVISRSFMSARYTGRHRT